MIATISLVPLIVSTAGLTTIWTQVGDTGVGQRAEQEQTREGVSSREAMATLHKALEAHGGQKNILRPRKGHITAVDKTSKCPITVENWFDLPNQWKTATTDYVDKKKHVSFMLGKDGKAWQWEEGGVIRPADRPKDIAVLGFGVLIQLAGFDNGKYTLSSLKELDIDGTKAVGLQVKRAMNQAQCYFDKTTGRLVRWDLNWEPKPGVMFHQKTLFDQYKRIDDVIVSCRQRVYLKGDGFRDWEQMAQLVLSEIEILANLPVGTFALPKKGKEEERGRRRKGDAAHFR